MIHKAIQAASARFRRREMRKTLAAKTGFAFCLLSLFALSASARDWDNYGFTPREPSLKQSGHWEWEWDGADGLGIGLVGATVRYVPTRSEERRVGKECRS